MAPPRRSTRGRSAPPPEVPEDSVQGTSDPFEDASRSPGNDDAIRDFSPSSPLPRVTSSPGVSGPDRAGPSDYPDGNARVNVSEAASMAENIPGVTLVLPSEEGNASRALLTPPARSNARPRSGGSSGNAAPKKKGKRRADLPSPHVNFTGEDDVTRSLKIRVPPLASVLDRLASRFSAPTTSTSQDPPLVIADDHYKSTVFTAALKGLDQGDPDCHSHVAGILSEVAPGIDFNNLLAALLPPPADPADLPDPNQRSLLPAFTHQVGPPSSSHPRSLPDKPVILDGFDLPIPAKVISALKSNWTVHIPITALTTRSIASTTWSSREDGQALLFKEGHLTVSSAKFSSKDESSICAQDWVHAYPCLIDAIRRYLPGPNAGDIADAWESHYTRLIRRTDFWDLFHVVLCYDIRLRIHYIDPKSGINPSFWQEEIWRQIVDAYRMGTQHTLPGLYGTSPPKAAPPTSLLAVAASSSSNSVSVSHRSLQTPAQRQPSYWTGAGPAPPSFRHDFQPLRCIFCGVAGCRKCACGLSKTNYISYSNGTWSTAQGGQVCFRFNGRGCGETNCPCAHVCSRCGASHSAQACSA
ncbi:hypothetical protein JVT61DRAFT_8800 [Boletus reticuloceps]|uniref:Uncharacterized protein n=1 Tax=Boletus reticuloceps TaxID=495285 RepID=A0A8I2YHY3_9AGAM|nr:hypothetical protein JVT61DRAFT_8800 [Boletus reticuloceps]